MAQQYKSRIKGDAAELSDELTNTANASYDSKDISRDTLKELCKLFWRELANIWIDVNYKFTIGENPMKLINECLGTLLKYVSIDATFHQINKQELGSAKGLIQLYITPRLDTKNIEVMNEVYKSKIDMPNLFVSKYRGFHMNDAFFEDIRYETFAINYKDVGCNTSVSYDRENEKQLLDVILVFNKKISGHVLERGKVEFSNKKKDINNGDVKSGDKGSVEFSTKEKPASGDKEDAKSREMWLPKVPGCIEAILVNAVGEYNYLNHMGYVELYPSNDPFVKDHLDNFTELETLRDNMLLVTKFNQKAFCNYCQHNELQVKLFDCARCKVTHYCCKACQRADWSNHKVVCKQ